MSKYHTPNYFNCFIPSGQYDIYGQGKLHNTGRCVSRRSSSLGGNHNTRRTRAEGFHYRNSGQGGRQTGGELLF